MGIYTELKLHLPASILTIGAFDGVHLGHQTLISRAKERANKLCVPLIVYTFDLPPRVYFNNAMLLTPLTEKLKRLELLGVDHVIIGHFNAEYVARDACSFLDELTVLHPLEVWIGRDFQFGRNKEGNVNTLRQRFNVHVLDPIRCSLGEIISSSRIRTLLTQNRLLQAEQLLGWKTIFHDRQEVNKESLEVYEEIR